MSYDVLTTVILHAEQFKIVLLDIFLKELIVYLTCKVDVVSNNSNESRTAFKNAYNVYQLCHA